MYTTHIWVIEENRLSVYVLIWNFITYHVLVVLV